jgi:hypothetical protein
MHAERHRKGIGYLFSQRCLLLAKIMSATTKWSNCGPYINGNSAFGSYASDLAPFQGASPGWAVPKVETLG